MKPRLLLFAPDISSANAAVSAAALGSCVSLTNLYFTNGVPGPGNRSRSLITLHQCERFPAFTVMW